MVDGLLKLPFVQNKSQTSLEFAVRLIGRVIFCWFLREKKSDQGKSLMPNIILSLEAAKNNPDYYHKILEPIFFEILDKPSNLRRNEYVKEPFSSIPYLNGGLFSPHEDDYYRCGKDEFQSQFDNALVVPDEWLISFFEILETYNFTIDENTSFDQELSIDPEMLGRIFENLLAEINPETGESARKSTGSYYTPRIIVDYMVDESLFLYLKNQTRIDDKKLRALMSYDLNDDSESPLSESEKESIIDALERVKILDPACGSGAFPIGALQKIVFILQQADPEGQLWFRKQIKNTSPEIRKVIEREFVHKNFDYIRKLSIIRENIYGIDIQPIASEISRLRCFLALIVDQRIQEYSENRGIQHLPNLDFKFVTANSLLGLPKLDFPQQSMFDDYNKIDELKQIRDEYFNASGIEREQLKTKFVIQQKNLIDQLVQEHDYMSSAQAEFTQKLTDWEPFLNKLTDWFDADWMFGIREGFDIIIANPPYVGEKGHKEEFRKIKRDVLAKFYLRKMDLFYFFFHLALNIGKMNSQIAFISTNYYLTAGGARKLRQDLQERSIVRRLLNFNELKIFESALGQHNIVTLLSKTNSINNSSVIKTCITRRAGMATPEILLSIVGWYDGETEYYSFPINELYDGKEFYFRLESISPSSNPKQRIINKIKVQGEVLGSLCNVSQGLLTGIDRITGKHVTAGLVEAEYINNGVYILNKEEYENLKLNSSEKQLLKAFFKNSDIKKYYCNQIPNSYVLYLTRNLDLKNYPNLESHVRKYEMPIKARSKDRGEMQAALRLGKWWVIFAARDEKVFLGPKIVSPQRSYENAFAYNEVEWYASADVYYITAKNSNIRLKYVISLLNSKLFYLWFYLRGKKKGEMLELLYTPLMEVPIKIISEKEQESFIKIVDKIIAITSSLDYLSNLERQAKVREYEEQINQMVYTLYDLTPEEIEIVENSSR